MGAIELGENKEIQKAKEEYDKIMADEHEKMLIKLREKYWLDYNSMKNASYDKGKAVGEKKKQEEIAKKMLISKLDINLIVELTGLTENEILALSKS